MKKLFVQAFLVLLVAAGARAGNFTDAGGIFSTHNAGLKLQTDLYEPEAGLAVVGNPDPFTQLPRKKSKPSKASKVSQSQRHTGERSRPYKSPASGSIEPANIGGSRGTPTPSVVAQTKIQGKPPLRLSKRDRYFGVGSREIGINVGTAHGFTDIQGSKGLPFGEALQFQIKNPGFTFGIYSKLRMVDWFGLSLGIDFGRIAGKENGTLDEEFQGYSFDNNLLELNARIVFYVPLMSKNIFDIYGFAGVALFHHNLSVFDADGEPYIPEGSYAKLQPTLPFGIGLSWSASPRMVIGYEIGYRYSAFNYLDGIAPPDTPFDAYLFHSLKLGFILKPRSKQGF